jgi:hypothetical protein
VMLLLGQTLTSLEKQWMLYQATAVGNDYYLPHTPSQLPIPTGDQAVPRSDPDCDPEDRADDWHATSFTASLGA